MRKTDCGICEQKEIPLNDTVKVDGKVYCNTCTNTHFPDKQSIEGRIIVKELDPTICAQCKKDFDAVELNKVAQYPVCPECETHMQNRALPNWVKAFFAAILVIVVGSFIWNWNYYMAYRDIKKANEYFQKGDFAHAYELMNLASLKVPEVEDINTYATYFKGVNFLYQDKNPEALAEFYKCREKMPVGNNVASLINQAKIGIDFANKDYEGFVEAAKENLTVDPSSASLLTSVASGYSYIYADKGDENAKAEALEYLARARTIDDTSKEMKNYYGMVEYRLETKKIISREDFVKEFPNGWTKK
jgi:tetratricopeptide (TPR) repeat protein